MREKEKIKNDFWFVWMYVCGLRNWMETKSSMAEKAEINKLLTYLLTYLFTYLFSFILTYVLDSNYAYQIKFWGLLFNLMFICV